MTWVYPGCTNLPTTYYWSYCITNKTGLAMSVMWVGTPNNSPQVNLGPGQYYCFTGSGTTFGFGGFTEAYYNPDGTATNISIWPPTGPNGTNAVPGSPGAGNQYGPGNSAPGGNGGTGPGGTAMGPGAGVPGSNTNLTGNQYYQGITNLQDTMQFSFGYLGNIIASGNLVQSNQLQLVIGQQTTNGVVQSMVTNQLSIMTNELAAIGTNIVGITTGLIGGYSNALYMFETNYDAGGMTNGYYSNADFMAGNMSNSWGNPFGGTGNGATNVYGAANHSYWFIPMNTNPLTAWDPAHPANDPNSGLDLDPRHSHWFNDFAAFMKNIEVWLITLFVLWQVREWMSERLLRAMATPYVAIRLDAAAITQAAIKTATVTAILIGLPVAMAAAAYNYAYWPGHITPLDPLSSGAQSLAGTSSPLIADSVDIVGNMFPIGFAGGAIIYLGVVWLALDTITAAAMFKLRSPL